MSSQTPIYDTPEYKLAPEEKKRWAFTHKDQYVSSIDAAKRMGVKLDDLKVHVKINTGDTIEVDAQASYYRIAPSAKYKSLRMMVNGKYETVYMIKGTNPKQKTAEYFTLNDFDASEEVKKLAAEIMNAEKEFRKQHREMIKTELVKSHSTLAKKAMKEIPALVDQDNAEQKVYDWFVKNGFTVSYIKPEQLKSFVKDVKRTGYIDTQFNISSKPDGYGHQTGVSGKINFDTKSIYTTSWSSDD